MSKSASICHGWRFLDCRVPRKKGNTFKTGGEKKTGAKAQPRYNGFRVISDRVITVLQCIWGGMRKQYKPRSDAEEWSESSLFSTHLTIFTHISREWKCTCLGWLGEAKVSSISCHWGQLRLVYSWAMPAILAAKGRGGMLLVPSVSSLSFIFLFLPCPSLSSPLLSLFSSPFLWETTKNDPQG